MEEKKLGLNVDGFPILKVSMVHPRSWAMENGIEVGDEVLKVNNKGMKEFESRKQLILLVSRVRPLQLLLRKHDAEPLEEISESEESGISVDDEMKDDEFKRQGRAGMDDEDESDDVGVRKKTESDTWEDTESASPTPTATESRGDGESKGDRNYENRRNSL